MRTRARNRLSRPRGGVAMVPTNPAAVEVSDERLCHESFVAVICGRWHPRNGSVASRAAGARGGGVRALHATAPAPGRLRAAPAVRRMARLPRVFSRLARAASASGWPIKGRSAGFRICQMYRCCGDLRSLAMNNRRAAGLASDVPSERNVRWDRSGRCRWTSPPQSRPGTRLRRRGSWRV